jgi:hypothetical protein
VVDSHGRDSPAKLSVDEGAYVRDLITRGFRPAA